MPTQPTKASSQKEIQHELTRAEYGWHGSEDGSSRIYFEAQGSGDPILLLPGFAGSIEEFSDLRDSPDDSRLPGYRSRSTRFRSLRAIPGRLYTATFFEEDTYAFVALLQHLVSEPVHLLGFGNGGEIALLMAALMPEVTRSVVAWGAVGVFNDPGGKLRKAICNIVDHPIPSLQKLRDSLVATYGKDQARAMTQSVVAAVSDFIKSGSELSRSKAHLFSCPVLLIAGEHDAFAPPALVCVLAVRMRIAEILVAQGAEHFAYMDQPEWLTHTILDWLAKHSEQPQNMSGMK